MEGYYATAEEMAFKCTNCGHENPEHIVYCGQCGESLREPLASAESDGGDMNTVSAASNGHLSSTQTQVSRRTIGHIQYPAAAIAALAGIILLVLALAFYVCYNELYVDLSSDHWESRDTHDLTLMNNLAKAYMYSLEIGEICVVLAIFLLVHGCLIRQRSGMSLASLAHPPLSRMRLLIALALACVTISFGLRLVIREAQVDWDMEGWLRVQSVATDLFLVAWVCVSIFIFMVARRMPQGVKSS